MGPGATDPLTELYEHVRSFVLQGSGLPGEVYGLGVLLRQGMRTWIETCMEHAHLERASGTAVLQVASRLPCCDHAEVTRLLAGMVLNTIEKEGAQSWRHI